MATTREALVAGNYFDKYRSKNPLHRRIMTQFVDQAKELVEMAKPRSVLEVGTGPGDLAHRLFVPTDERDEPTLWYTGIDISEEQVQIARERYPQLSFQRASVYDLPFEDGMFDLCLACEVFEHLDAPNLALAEIARVTREHLLISVPYEPLWRILNVCRGRYLRDFGNTPGHVQHFSRRTINQLVRTEFDIVAERNPFPWTMLLATHPLHAKWFPKKPR